MAEEEASGIMWVFCFKVLVVAEDSMDDTVVLGLFVILAGASVALVLGQYPLRLPPFQPLQRLHRDLVTAFIRPHRVHVHGSITLSFCFVLNA